MFKYLGSVQLNTCALYIQLKVVVMGYGFISSRDLPVLRRHRERWFVLERTTLIGHGSCARFE